MEIPEQAVLGNSRMVATIGRNGELRYLFWPTIDYPQHVLGSLPGVYYKGLHRFEWLTDPPWTRRQKYIENTNVLRTDFFNPETKLAITAVDFVVPEMDVLVRHFLVKYLGDEEIFVRFFYYNDLALGETYVDDVAYYHQKADAIIHYKRRYYFIYGGSLPSSGHQCGVHYEQSDAFADVYDGHLSGGSLVLYNGTKAVNSCLSWDIGSLKKNVSKELTLYIAMGKDEEEVLKLLEKSRSAGYTELRRRTEAYWKYWLNRFKHKPINEELNRLIKRSLLVLKLLIDKNYGGIVAAPTMSPEYRFCWPRDATYVAYALDMCGYHEETESYYNWCSRAQEKEGGLYQRYFIEPTIKGPCWSSQIDEVATVVWGIARHYEFTGSRKFLHKIWPTVRRAANFLCENIDARTGLVTSVGLWEEKFGSHTYSNAAVYRALKESAKIALIKREDELAMKWSKAAETVKNSILTLLWDSDIKRFIKTYKPRDDNVDASLLGLSFPFRVLSPGDPKMLSTAKAIEEAFNFKVGGIGRYPGDAYYGGNPWTLTTLWLAIYYNQLKRYEKSWTLIQWTIDHATDLELFPEQVEKNDGKPVSAVPLAWSHAFFIIAASKFRQTL